MEFSLGEYGCLRVEACLHGVGLGHQVSTRRRWVLCSAAAAAAAEPELEALPRVRRGRLASRLASRRQLGDSRFGGRRCAYLGQ